MNSKPASWNLEVDFIAIGSGIGGLSGAIVAHDEGLTTIVLEKASLLGGVTAYSAGEIWVPNNHLMKERGLKDSQEAAQKYLEFLAGGFADQKLASIFLNMSPAVCQYFGDNAGVRWKIIKGFPDYYHPFVEGTTSEGRYLETEIFQGAELGEWATKTRLTPHAPNGITHDEMIEWGGGASFLNWDFELLGQRITEDCRTFGPGLMAYFVKAAMVDRKIPAYLETPVRQLLTEDGAVIGVRAERDGKDFNIRARKGVLLAIGGYDWNPEMVRYFEQMPEVHSAAPPQVEGDHFIMACELGAAIAALPLQALAILFGRNVPGEEAEGKPLWRTCSQGGYPHAVLVNRYGRRFCDESFYREYHPKMHIWDGLRQEYSNYPPYLIFDQNYREKYPFGTYVPEQPIPEDVAKQADTLRELAGKLDIDADGLEAEIERYNQFCIDGNDKDFARGSYPWANFMIGDLRNKPNPNMGPLEKPPFYGVQLVMNLVGINSAGLKTNANAEVMHIRGYPISGLYAAGNTAALLDTGAGYQSGMACTRGMLWGYIAAKHAAGSWRGEKEKTR